MSETPATVVCANHELIYFDQVRKPMRVPGRHTELPRFVVEKAATFDIPDHAPLVTCEHEWGTVRRLCNVRLVEIEPGG